jgi:hypothetical protein
MPSRKMIGWIEDGHTGFCSLMALIQLWSLASDKKFPRKGFVLLRNPSTMNYRPAVLSVLF